MPDEAIEKKLFTLEAHLDQAADIMNGLMRRLGERAITLSALTPPKKSVELLSEAQAALSRAKVAGEVSWEKIQEIAQTPNDVLLESSNFKDTVIEFAEQQRKMGLELTNAAAIILSTLLLSESLGAHLTKMLKPYARKE